jgi:DNA-binding NtrC family response regulator
MRSTVLVVDHDPTHRSSLERMLEVLGYDARFAGNGEDALAFLAGQKGQTIDLLMLDLVMPELDGLGVLHRLKAIGLRIPAITMVTPKGVDGVLGAIAAGASDFVIKPVGPERLQVSLMNALRFKSLVTGFENHHHRSKGVMTLEQLGASDPAIARLTELAGKALKGNWPVLIEGEHGTGKTPFAHAIHASSGRSRKPFVHLDCSTLRSSDSMKRITAAMERVKSGTLYLSAVHSLDPAAQLVLAQAKMVVEPSLKTPRLIADSRLSLIELVKSGSFREDLFYRLTVTPLRIPALRERPFDLAHLAEQTALRIAAETGKPIRGLTDRAKAFLAEQEWPGNFPDFEAALRMAVNRASTPWLTDADFRAGKDLTLSQPAKGYERDRLALFDDSGALRPFAEIEHEIFEMAQRHCGGSLGRAAKALGLGRSTLYRKIQDKMVNSDATQREPLPPHWRGEVA